jgi:alpha-tubulin suppressor-like RCC1 family protein
MCVRALPGGDINNVREVYSWGYNAYGELGVGDIMIRLQPTKLTGGIETAVVESVNCGPRHSVIRTAFKPKRVIDDVTMNTYFKIIEKDPEN